MLARVHPLLRRLSPKGPIDLARQVLLLVAAFLAYRISRGLVDGSEAARQAFANARDLIDIERATGTFVEPSVQAFVAGERWLLDGASWMYLNAQTSITLGALLWIYLFRTRSFYFVRNMFLVTFALALVGYAVFPTAPPRFLPEWGFFDAVAEFTGVPQDSVAVDALFNPYAAVPSMHVGFAVMISLPLSRLVRHRAVKGLWLAYPALVTFVIVVTANHFLADAVLGALT
ncbi:MAG: phosphatase PAP2 family protein, partial [Solirubrobacterales bacterium]|nr:phosphatase PAP2 family protein [Solirubrobacterales bacterium]